MEVIDGAGRAPLIDDAAQIWAEATAARDRHDQVPSLEVARPVIQGVLDRSSRAVLLIARSADGTTAGFAAIEPAPGSDGTVAQLSHLGVRPGRWGQGIGATLLLQTCQWLKAAGYASAELSVYVDNSRATALYERLGWRAIGLPTAHRRPGNPNNAMSYACNPRD